MVNGERAGTFGFVAMAGAAGISAGLLIIAGTVLGVTAVRTDQDLRPAFYLLTGGTLAGVVAAAATVWWLLGPVQSTYRRGGLAMVAGFATVLTMLICMPIYQLLGSAGLLGLIALSAVTSLLLVRRARRLGTPS